MERQPRGRDILKLLWSIHRRDAERDLKRMAGVRRPVLRVVHSQLSDEEAVRRIRPDVQANYGAARATLDHVRQADEFGSGYITDRAVRILEAAMNGTSPAPISAERRELFERERDLGWKSLADAFNEIARLVPGLTELLTRIASEPDRSSRRLERMQELRTMVGRDASATDALIRSSLVAQIVYRYLHMLEGKLGAPDPERSVWEWRPNVEDRRTDQIRREAGLLPEGASLSD